MEQSADEYLIDLFLQSLLLIAKMPKDLRDTLEEAIMIEKQRRETIEKRLEEQL